MSEILEDGFSTTIEFSASDSGVLMTDFLKEMTVTSPGVEMGGENDITSMRNTEWRTKVPKKLKTLTPITITAQYDPEVIDEIVATAGINQSIVVTFPDNSTLTFWGWIESWIPGEKAEGVLPTGEMTVICSNRNATGVETAPLYAA